MKHRIIFCLLVFCAVNIRKANLCKSGPPRTYNPLSQIPKANHRREPDCTEEDKVYYGNAINEALGYNEHMHGADADEQDCYTFCLNNPSCKFWNFISMDVQKFTSYTAPYGSGGAVEENYEIRKCQVFGDINTQKRYDHPLQSRNGDVTRKYSNFRVISGRSTCTLDDAQITEKWELLITCDARGISPAFKKCAYERKEGMSRIKGSSSDISTSFTQEFGIEYGYSKAVKATFKESSTTGYNWGSTSSNTFSSAQTTSTWIEAAQGEVVSVCQPVAIVENDYVFKPKYYRSVYSTNCPRRV